MRHLAGLVVAVCILAPQLASAAGLVPCGRPGQEQCQTCHVVALMNNVLVWILGFLTLLAVIVILYIGFLFVTSRGELSVIQRGKRMFVNIFIGIIITFIAWIVVDLLVTGLLDTNVSGPWNIVQCVEQPEFTVGLPDIIDVVNGRQEIFCTDPTKTREELEEAGCIVQNCTTQAECEASCDGGTVHQLPPPAVGWYCATTNYVFPTPLPNEAACDPSVVSQYFGGMTDAARCIISKESACGANPISATDVLHNEGNLPFSFGAMQINITVHQLQGCGPGGSTLNCPSAFSGTNYSARIVNRALYDQCAAAAQDVACNLSNGRIIRDNRGSWADWSTAGACGLLQ